MAAADKKQAANTSTQSKIPISMRVKAWWDGNELQIRNRSRAAEATDYSPNKMLRTLDRPTLLQELWGPGFCDPGSTEFILQLVKPLGLDPSMTVVNLGAGLGGAARVMVEHFGPWVQGLESDKVLATTGMSLSEMAGMAKKAEIIHFNPTHYAYRPGTADCVLAKEFFWKLEDKDRMVQNAATLLKDRGQFLFTDYVLTEGTEPSDVAGWSEAEAGTFALWTKDQYEDCLKTQKFEVRINEDITQDFSRLVTDGWGAFLRNSRIDDLNPETGEALIQEAEIWTRRAKAIDNGQVNVQRIYAIKKIGSSSTMSDW